MRLLYTLRYGASAGNCGGDLRLFFTTQNPLDWEPAPPGPAPGMWLGNNLTEAVRLPSGDSLHFTLDLVNNGMPALLYLFGSITVTPASGQTFPPGTLGQATANFSPGQPVMTVWKGRSQGTSNGVTWDIGFEMAVPWDGTSADCHGQWWAIWH